jgi:integrase
MSRWDLPADSTLEGLSDKWLEDIQSTIDQSTGSLYRLHMRTHLCPHFGNDPRAVRTASIAEYGRRRLRAVKRSTLQKERSTLRGFLAWCEEQGYLLESPEFPKLPRKATGTAFSVRRRGTATELTPEECERLIAALPQWSRPRSGKPSFPVRARFIVAYETALRPATLDALSVPEHYSRGAGTLVITDEIDKARFGRTLPLTGAARVALDSVCRAGMAGPIFGEHDYRWQLKKAAKAINMPAAKLRTFCAYDLRHNRLTELAEGGNLTGVAYLAGHKRVTTTSIYVRPGLRAGERALDQAEQSRANQRSFLVGVSKLPIVKALCEGEDSNLHALSGASTSIHRASAHQLSAHAARSEAIAILAAAASGEDVSEERVIALALGAIALTPTGRLALAVLEGGPFAPRRVIELARALADGTAGAHREEGSR